MDEQELQHYLRSVINEADVALLCDDCSGALALVVSRLHALYEFDENLHIPLLDELPQRYRAGELDTPEQIRAFFERHLDSLPGDTLPPPQPIEDETR
ncbi:hypothetical protein [Pseudoalteromonas sp. T1lg88]|uniref:hypothetical protein n=1 Tax=Pseudoalteromonas sp. T1lg88 TaxID=2077104 RepID=UPI000CF6732B|nr:hypothetical protein [Pseudoalteromonas sp. T1lg88]